MGVMGTQKRAERGKSWEVEKVSICVCVYLYATGAYGYSFMCVCVFTYILEVAEARFEPLLLTTALRSRSGEGY